MKYLLLIATAAGIGCGPAAEVEGLGTASAVRTEPACSAESCSGCCDAFGVCQAPTDLYCGKGGAACVQCLGHSTCGSEEGRCVATSGGGFHPSAVAHDDEETRKRMDSPYRSEGVCPFDYEHCR